MQSGLINLYTDFSNFGGAQNVSFSLHKGLSHGEKNFLMGFTSYQDINNKYPILKVEEYLQFSIRNIKKHKSFIFISHHRKITTYLCLINRLFFLNLKIIHVAHNEFFSLKYLSFFSKNVIAVSERVKQNHIDFLGIPENNIEVIHNGIEDTLENISFKQKKDKITILYPARINAVKGQLALMNELKGKLSNEVIIEFAGIGEDEEILKKFCENSSQFNYLGFVNLEEVMGQYDYVMLFSKNEGLPLTLIEAGMYGRPVITNNVGGNTEVVENKLNGYVQNNYSDLLIVLNDLPIKSADEYYKLCQNARRIYSEKFTITKMIVKYKKYLELIKN